MYSCIFHQNGNAPALNVQIPNYLTHFFTLKIQSETHLKMKTISIFLGSNLFWELEIARTKNFIL